MTATEFTRRGALHLALGAAAGSLGAVAGAIPASARLYRRLGVAFGTTVAITVEASDALSAEAAFAAGFAEIRHIDRLASLTDPEGQVFRLNRDGFLDRPDPALIEMLEISRAMHAATAGAFDVTIQPLWLAFDAAAKKGRWPSDREIATLLARVDQSRLVVSVERIAFAESGMGVTLNSLARGLAADRVAAALRRVGVSRAFFDTDVLGGLGARPDGARWRARVRDPRDAVQSVAVAEVAGCLATSGDYQYFWTPDYSRHHIVDARRGVSPGAFSSVSVLAPSGLEADALSTAAFLLGADAARALLARVGAQALFVDKSGCVSATPGFPVYVSNSGEACAST